MKPIGNPVIALFLLFFVLVLATPGFSQTDAEKYVYGTFRGTRIVNGHSVQTLHTGEMEMVIGHRFGRLNGGAYQFFGLDQSSIRIGLDYGLKDWLTVGVGRSSVGKELDSFLKLRLLRQGLQGGMPVSVTAFSSVAYNTLHPSDQEHPLAIQNRLAFTYQFLIARKVSDRLSLQLMPTLAHYNLVETIGEPNDKIAIGVAGRYQLTKNLALTSEYYYMLPGYLPPEKKNPLSIGIDLNTGSHVFQLHFTNSSGMIEKQFLGETTGSWGKGDIQFGFNIVRTFKLKGRRY